MKSAVLIALSISAIVVSSAHAQPVPGYLADTDDAALRVEIVDISVPIPPQTGWQRLLALVGLRKTQPYRPEAGTTFTVQSSAYASSPYQTDATPCITAVGTRVRPGVVASNFLPIGTVLDINGEKYIVEDRMNPRYDGYFLDIWFPSTSSALEFGRRQLAVTVVGYEDPGADVRQEEVIEEDPENARASQDPASTQPAPNEPTFFEQVRLTFANLAQLIGAKVSPDVNRYDVDCLSEDATE